MDPYGDGAALGSSAIKPATRKSTSIGKITANTAVTNVAGRWHLELSEGRSIDLDLFQLGERIFGRGSLSSGTASQPATASGSVLRSSIIIDVVTENATELYAISLDMSRLHLASPYTEFLADGETSSGTVKAFRIAPSTAA